MDLIVCLDSDAWDYERFWITTSGRGSCDFALKVKTAENYPLLHDTFSVAAHLLERIEDSKTGDMIESFNVQIPQNRKLEIEEVAKRLGSFVYTQFELVPGLSPVNPDPCELLLNRTWRSSLVVMGLDGIPPITPYATEPFIPYTSIKLTINLPPTLDVKIACQKMKDLLTANTPFGMEATFENVGFCNGFHSPDLPSDLDNSIKELSKVCFLYENF